MKKSNKNRILSETSEETKQKAKDYGDSLVKKTYTEEEVKELAGQVCADMGLYIATCIMTIEDNPDTGGKFEELFEKYKKK
jgi:hypothetical protein